MLGVENATVDWDELAALEAGGIRIESHGIGHRPLSDLDPAEATREIAISKLRLEERLGREVEAYAFVKGARRLPARAREPRAAGRVQARVHLGLGRNGPDRLPGSAGTTSSHIRRGRFELVLRGACDLIAVNTVLGSHARRVFNAVLGTASR